MRGLLLAALCVGATAGPAAASSVPPDPCRLVTAADATSVFGASPVRSASSGAGTRTCTYRFKAESMTIETRALAGQTAFVDAAKTTKGLVLPIATIANAYSAQNGHELLLWKNGVEVTVRFVGLDPVFATQASIASAALHGL